MSSVLADRSDQIVGLIGTPNGVVYCKASSPPRDLYSVSALSQQLGGYPPTIANN